MKHIYTSTLSITLFIVTLLLVGLNVAKAFPADTGIKSSASINAAAQQPVRIMPLGNSITYDEHTGDKTNPRPAGDRPAYRQKLWQLLSSTGYNFDFVGSRRSGQNLFPDAENAGFPGFSIQQTARLMRTGYDPRNGVQETPGPYLETHPADIILLHIGVNDINKTPADTSRKYLNLILNEIDRYEQANNTSVTVIMAQVVNRVPVIGAVTEFNNNVIKAIADERIAKGDKIKLVNMEQGAGLIYSLQANGGDMYDQLHPVASGYEKMAQVWFDALKPLLNTVPVISSAPVTTVPKGNSYTYNVEASGNPNPTYQLKTAPQGMQINPTTGAITWAATQSGNYNVTVEATSAAGTATQDFVLAVTEVPVITSTPTLIVEAEKQYTYDVQATGHPAPAYTLQGAPAGMTIDAASGLISWVPSQAGSFNIKVIATNAVGTAEQAYTLVVEEKKIAPSITSAPIKQVQIGQLYQYNAEATGNPTAVYTLTKSPEGMAIDPASGIVSWTPTKAGDFTVAIKAANQAGEAIQEFILTVTPLPPTQVQDLNAVLLPDEKAVEITWGTEGEIGNAYFEIERSLNGTDFTTVGKIDGSGTTNEAKTYAFTDVAAPRGTLHYRLKQVDMFGKENLSAVVKVNNVPADTSPFLVFPTKSQGQPINLQVNSENPNTQVQFLLYGADGKLVDEFTAQTDNYGELLMKYKLPWQRTAGLYIIKAILPDNTHTGKFIVEH